MTSQPWLRQLLALSASGAGLGLLGAHPAAVIDGLRDPHAWVARVGADAAAAQLATLLIWCLLAVVLAGLLMASVLALAAQLPGRAGAMADALAAVAVPYRLRRLLGAGIGTTLALAVAPAAHAGTPLGPAASNSAAQVLPAPGVPRHEVGRLALAPALPVVHLVTAADDAAEPGDGSADGAARGLAEYPVRAGDSLWRLAQRCHPGASSTVISTLWPRWYAANRDVVGPDPNVLQPGQVLRVPGSGCTGSSR